MQDFITLSEAAKRVPGRPNSATVWRWARKGIIARDGSRVKLEHRRCGARIFVPPEALDQFFKSVADADARFFDAQRETQRLPDLEVPRPTSAMRRKQIEAAKRELAARGIPSN